MSNEDLKIIRLKNIIITDLCYSKDPFLSGSLKGDLDIIIRGREYTIPISIVYGRYFYIDDECDDFDENLLTPEIVEKINNFLEENSDIYYDLLPDEIMLIKKIRVNKNIL